jgi:hypothetical protein
MSALSVRLDKLAAKIPPPRVLDTTERPKIDFKVMFAEMEAESARVKALPPIQKLMHILGEIEKIRREAVTPYVANPADGLVRASLAEALHKFAVMDVKKGFPSHQWEKRRCEILILREHGYDAAELDRAHRAMAHLPWQWVHYQTPLPPDAQAIIDQALIQEAAP